MNKLKFASIVLITGIVMIIAVPFIVWGIDSCCNHHTSQIGIVTVADSRDVEPAPAKAGKEEMQVAEAAVILYTTGNVNMRTNSSLDGEIVQVLNINTQVTKVADEGEWSKIKWSEEEYYYIKSELLSEEETQIIESHAEAAAEQIQVETDNSSSTPAADVIIGYLTHYGPDCAGCGGTTSAGYYVGNTMYYTDATFGTVRIVAMSSNYPLYSIIRINNYKYGSIVAIVLDRGGAIQGNKVDLLCNSEAEASQAGIQRDINIEVLRWGA